MEWWLLKNAGGVYEYQQATPTILVTINIIRMRIQGWLDLDSSMVPGSQ